MEARAGEYLMQLALQHATQHCNMPDGIHHAACDALQHASARPDRAALLHDAREARQVERLAVRRRRPAETIGRGRWRMPIERIGALDDHEDLCFAHSLGRPRRDRVPDRDGRLLAPSADDALWLHIGVLRRRTPKAGESETDGGQTGSCKRYVALTRQMLVLLSGMARTNELAIPAARPDDIDMNDEACSALTDRIAHIESLPVCVRARVRVRACVRARVCVREYAYWWTHE
jgi:hypothetical protein